MNRLVLALVVVVGCSKKEPPPTPSAPASASAPAPAPASASASASAPAPAPASASASASACASDHDCFPAECCHARACSTVRPHCEGIACTAMVEPGTLDVGHCVCRSGRCAAVIPPIDASLLPQ